MCDRLRVVVSVAPLPHARSGGLSSVASAGALQSVGSMLAAAASGAGGGGGSAGAAAYAALRHSSMRSHAPI